MKLSIIIPVYNSEKYLGACLDSCLDQKPFKIGVDYEILCVDDGSLDGSRTILEQYALRGIRYIHQANQGVSAARNNGMKNARGEYIWFVDSDDLIPASVLHLVVAEMGKYKAIGCTFRLKEISENFEAMSIKTSSEELTLKKNVLAVNNAFLIIANRDYLLTHDIFFKQGMVYGEDTLWAYYVQLYSVDFIDTDAVLYYYRQNPNSAMHTKDVTSRRKWLHSMMMMLEEYKNVLDNWTPEMLESKHQETKDRFEWSVQNVMFGALRMPREECQKIWRTLKEQGHYPYKIQWNRLFGSKGLGDFKTNAFCLLFPYSWYYKLLVKLMTR